MYNKFVKYFVVQNIKREPYCLICERDTIDYLLSNLRIEITSTKI